VLDIIDVHVEERALLSKVPAAPRARRSAGV
jgi:hypothetical protein